ncbi:family 78 glycoside hydrolase catalytic domain [Arcicella sp. LKC2W]|uniref:alpha-L-rhamnosidase n=1 Tax=Arcicella sp. LKC2W TaxID=2984198 RepID=UPI002B211FEC|nr:family 78 glycoside hydrolase catalytic domain [Arcicella sp. LKC2W]MEA5457950.1 family 78 glycoside hydrolase catalytic domain [Arcicella sp. LKC2W]
MKITQKLLGCCSLFLLITFSTFAQVQISEMTCEHKQNPMGVDVQKPRLSWKLKSSERNILQTAYQIRVFSSQTFDKKNLVWDSGKTASGASILQAYKGTPLQSGKTYFWQVKIWDNQARESVWSNSASWEMGLLSLNDWKSQWIEPAAQVMSEVGKSPASMLRKGFSLKGKIVSARAYVTSHGYYELSLNGQKVGNEVLTPGWTAYHKRLQYQSYDVTNMLRSGANAVGAMLGEGWFRSTLGWTNNRGFYGKRLGLLCQINVKYANGTEETIVSDGSWKYTNDTPITVNEIYDGESYDATREIKAWNEPTFNDNQWANVTTATFDNSNLVSSEGAKIERIEEIKPLKIFRTPKGLLVADMGQNMVGWMRLKVSGAKGTKIVLRHAEVLDKYGDFYIENLRTAKVTLTYTLKGEGVETYEPHFTFMGFRYVSIEGMDLKPENLTGVVVHSGMKPTGTFECSNPLVNQLQHNIQWGQKGNFVDVPTDCPQRDERLGWTGDAQAFCRTAAYNFDVAAFFTKWLKDVAADQRPDGSVPFVVPDILNKMDMKTVQGSAGWGDVAVIAPWTMYLTYGDKQLLENQYPSMKAYVEFMRKKAGDSYLWKNGSAFGDWLYYKPAMNSHTEPDGYTDRDYLCQAFFAYSTHLLQESAEALGKTEDAKMYAQLLENIKKAFNEQYVTPSGRIASDSQTAYVLALMFDLLPQNLQSKAADYLVKDIKSRQNHLSTGFLGTPYLCHVLSQSGHTDVAYDLLLQETYPSWLYPVKMGATTIWERWDGQKVDSTFQDVGMNSFNHYAYGAIGDWMYRVVTGIEIDSKSTGYKHFYIKPEPSAKLSYAKSSLNSPYGEIASGWELKDGKIKLTVKIPANTIATITLPKGTNEATEGGKTIAQSGFQNIKTTEKGLEFDAGAGEYVFEYKF